MHETTIKALEDSVRKWDCIAQGIGIDEGTKNCPLCTMYFDPFTSGFTGYWRNTCNDCPVYKKVNESECRDTPYEAIHLYKLQPLPVWIKSILWATNRVPIRISNTLYAIEAEIEFLISLLPENHKLKEL